MLKLYQSYLSPFPTRVRLVLYAKKIDFEVIRPSGFHGDPNEKGEYLDVNPIGRIPALQLEDGRVLGESEVICEYLEDAYPEPPLMPEDAWGRAEVRLISRICDFYIVMAMAPLFSIVATPPETWDQKKIAGCLEEIGKSLDMLEAHIGEGQYAAGNSLTHADGTLLPILLLVDFWLPIFRGPDLWLPRPKVHNYWKSLGNDPICEKLIKETKEAMKASM